MLIALELHPRDVLDSCFGEPRRPLVFIRSEELPGDDGFMVPEVVAHVGPKMKKVVLTDVEPMTDAPNRLLVSKESYDKVVAVDHPTRNRGENVQKSITSSPTRHVPEFGGSETHLAIEDEERDYENRTGGPDEEIGPFGTDGSEF